MGGRIGGRMGGIEEQKRGEGGGGQGKNRKDRGEGKDGRHLLFSLP